MGLAEAREALGGAHGDISKVPQERGVHPVNLTALGTKSHVFGPKGALAQTATSEGVFYPEFTARVCFSTCAWVQLCWQAVPEEARWQIDLLSLPWSQPGGSCPLPDAEQTLVAQKTSPRFCSEP